MDWSLAQVRAIDIPTWSSEMKDGYRYTVFRVEVTTTDEQNWTVAKRYSDFRLLHKSLRAQYATVRQLQFPGKKFFMSLALRVIEQRRAGFERYLNALLSINPCPIELFSFLSPINDEIIDRLSDNTVSSDVNVATTDVHTINLVTNMFQSFDLSTISKSKANISDASHDNRANVHDFTILKVLGKGSFGKVYLVRGKRTNELYAMKVLTKTELIKRHQVDHTMTERKVMSLISHPFIVTLRYAFQTNTNLFLVSDFCNGGEVFFHLKKFRSFSEQMVIFYSAELISAISYLHSKKIIYRDLKPENILLDQDGHIRITDFGLSKENVQTLGGAKTFCGTPEYLAPEMILSRKFKTKYGASVDYWSLGTLMYEMLTGWPPFFDRNLTKMCEKILHAPLKFPLNFSLSSNIKSLISGLLIRDPSKRLGCSEDRGVLDLKQHPVYKHINWDELEQRQITPPFKPRLKNEEDLQNFDKEFTKQTPKDMSTQEPVPLLSPNDEFTGFSFTFGKSKSNFNDSQEGFHTFTNRNNSIS